MNIQGITGSFKSLVDYIFSFLCRFKTMGVNLVLLHSSVTKSFFKWKFSVVFLKCHAHFRTEVQNRWMDGVASICDCSAATIFRTLWTSICIRPKHYPQHPQEVHEEWIDDG